MKDELIVLLIITLSLSIIGVILTYKGLKHKQTRKNLKRIIKFTFRG